MKDLIAKTLFLRREQEEPRVFKQPSSLDFWIWPRECRVRYYLEAQTPGTVANSHVQKSGFSGGVIDFITLEFALVPKFSRLG